MKNEITTLRDAGFAVHLLRPKSKRPYEKEWSEAPILSADALLAAYRIGDNIGLRAGEPSKVAGGYAHLFDLDIRIPDQADEAWAAFRAVTGLNPDEFPCVKSGSGGESRHIHFISDRPFRSKLLAHSEGKHRRETVDPATGEKKQTWSWDWEIELFGTGKQVVLPPSIHPDTGKPYEWVRPFDFDLLDMGIAPVVPSETVESWGVVDSETYEFETREPLDFKPGQLERDLDAIEISDLHYDDWIRLGQALHHQFGGSQEGFDLWVAHTKRSSKFTGDAQLREMRRVKWRSFGRYRGRPVTMGTVRAWAQEARAAELIGELDDLDDLEADEGLPDLGDLLGESEAADPLADAMAALMKETPADELPWQSLLDINEEGGIKATLHNLRLIVENDVWTHGVMAFNEFTQEVVQRGEPGKKKKRRENQAKPTLQLTGPSWRMRDKVNGDFWTEDKDNAIRALIESPKTQGGYGIKVPDRDLRAAIDIVGRKNCFHPIREYLQGLKWDRKPRVERLFIDYLGAPDDAYARSVATLTLIGGVARVMEPGCKFDSAVILQGLQGRRKSTFISVLAKSWFAELEGEIDKPQQMVEMMQGAWILELPELGGFVRADVRHIKAFLSRRSDKVRLAYAKRAQEFHRQCVFFGSTNDVKYLKDDTGNRRFWPINCCVDSIDTDRLEVEIDQIWAEALVLYQEMRKKKPHGNLPLFLDGEAKVIAEKLQESARVETADDGVAGRIEAWLGKPVFTGDIADSRDGRPRVETCLMEIWAEALGRDLKDYNQQNAQMVGRAMSKIGGWAADGHFKTFDKYGRQRLYERK